MAIVKKRIPGFQDGGNAVEPTTGNEVPIGSLPEEVADDIPAHLSAGEFVIPADVVRFIGLERLMKMRDEAKAGLQRMSEIGQMGNAEEVGEKADDSFGEDDAGFESTIDGIMSEVDADAQTQQAFAQGGAVGGPAFLTGYDMSKAPKNPVFDVRYFKHSDGRMMYVTFYNGRPMTPIPSGFTEVEGPVEQQVGKEAEEKEKQQTTTPSKSISDPNDRDDSVVEGGYGVVGTGPNGEITEKDLAIGDAVSPKSVKLAATILGAVTGLPLGIIAHNKSDEITSYLTNLAGESAGRANQVAVASQYGLKSDDPMVPFLIDQLSSPVPDTSSILEPSYNIYDMVPPSPAPEVIYDYGPSAPEPSPTPAPEVTYDYGPPAPEPAPAPAPEVTYDYGPPAPSDNGGGGYDSNSYDSWGASDYGGWSFKKGGLVKKPTKAPKPQNKQNKKGLASR